MASLDETFWDDKHASGDTPWQLTVPSPPIIAYLDQIQDKHIRILIPGAGQGFELDYLIEQGFSNIDVCDISDHAIEALQKRIGNHAAVRFITGDFFELSGQYDLILEQTFFCALNPELRTAYIDKMYELLSQNGKLVGVLFASHFVADGPPFGGTENEYKELFQKKLHIKKLDMCYNSVKPRSGNELFFIFKKPEN